MTELLFPPFYLRKHHSLQPFKSKVIWQHFPLKYMRHCWKETEWTEYYMIHSHAHPRQSKVDIFFWTQFYLWKLRGSPVSNISNSEVTPIVVKSVEITRPALFFHGVTWHAPTVTAWRTFTGKDNLLKLRILEWN